MKKIKILILGLFIILSPFFSFTKNASAAGDDIFCPTVTPTEILIYFHGFLTDRPYSESLSTFAGNDGELTKIRAQRPGVIGVHPINTSSSGPNGAWGAVNINSLVTEAMNQCNATGNLPVALAGHSAGGKPVIANSSFPASQFILLDAIYWSPASLFSKCSIISVIDGSTTKDLTLPLVTSCAGQSGFIYEKNTGSAVGHFDTRSFLSTFYLSGQTPSSGSDTGNTLEYACNGGTNSGWSSTNGAAFDNNAQALAFCNNLCVGGTCSETTSGNQSTPPPSNSEISSYSYIDSVGDTVTSATLEECNTIRDEDIANGEQPQSECIPVEAVASTGKEGDYCSIGDECDAGFICRSADTGAGEEDDVFTKCRKILTTPTTTPANQGDLSSVAGGLIPACPETGCGWPEFMELIQKVIHFLIFDLTLVITAIVFAYSGFLLMTSGDDSAKRTKAKNMFIKVFAGFVIAMAAWLIVNTILTSLISKERLKENPNLILLE